MKKWLFVVGSLIAVGCVGAGIAYAVIPSGGMITGCYAKSGGALRVIDSTVTNCKSGETRLDWNVQGPAGTNGTNGTNGVSGFEIVTSSGTEDETDGTQVQEEAVSCPAGKVALATGGHAEFFKSNAFETQGQVASTDIEKQSDGSYQAIVGFARLDGAEMTTGESMSYSLWATCATVGS